MAPFATVEDLATYIQKDLTAAESATATLMLDVATQAIKDEVDQALVQVTETVTLRGNGHNRLLLPQIPVTAVTTVVAGDDADTWVVNDDYVWERAGILTARCEGSFGSVWPFWEPVVVTYTHGFATVPQSLQGICLRFAATMMGNPKAVTGQSIGTFRETYPEGSGSQVGTASSGGFTPTERRILDRYRA